MLSVPLYRSLKKRDSVTSSSEYEDALDVPYQRIEEFASMLAEQVIMNSLAMSQRERNCALRVSDA